MKNNKPELSIDKHGNEFWLLNGKLHREDGPALIYSGGTKNWLLNGKLHREDGPAVIYFYGTKEWWLNGKLHRENGPAVIEPDGNKEWWLNEIQYTYEEWLNLLTPEQQINYLWNLDEE